MSFHGANLSSLEIYCTWTLPPRMLASFLMKKTWIYFSGGLIQLQFFYFLAGAGWYLLSLMPSDWYLVLYKPLHCVALTCINFFFQIVPRAWRSGFLASSTLPSLASQLMFHSPNESDHFFRAFYPLIKPLPEWQPAGLPTGEAFCSNYLLMLKSCTWISDPTQNTPSIIEKEKPFSICFSHHMAVSPFYGILIVDNFLANTKD